MREQEATVEFSEHQVIEPNRQFCLILRTRLCLLWEIAQWESRKGLPASTRSRILRSSPSSRSCCKKWLHWSRPKGPTAEGQNSAGGTIRWLHTKASITLPRRAATSKDIRNNHMVLEQQNLSNLARKPRNLLSQRPLQQTSTTSAITWPKVNKNHKEDWMVYTRPGQIEWLHLTLDSSRYLWLIMILRISQYSLEVIPHPSSPEVISGLSNLNMTTTCSDRAWQMSKALCSP